MAKYARPKVTTISRDEPLTGDINLDVDANSVLRNKQYQPPNNIFPNDRHMISFTICLEGRVRNNNLNNPIGVTPDGLWNLIDTVIVRGTDKVLGKKVDIINVRGSSLRQLVKIQGNTPSDIVPNALALGPGQANDFRLYLDVPFIPLNMPLHQQIDWSFDATNYDNLQLIIQVADDLNVFLYGANRGLPVFSAFGSDAGTPRIRLTGEFIMYGQNMGEGFKPGRVYRYFAEDISNDLLSNNAKVPLVGGAIPRGKKIRSALLKVGQKSQAVTAGNTAWSSLSNAVLANLTVNRGTNKAIRQYMDQFDARHKILKRYGNAPDVGYVLIDFAPNGSIHEALDLTDAIGGATGEILTYFSADVTTPGANAGVEFMWEELDGPPIYPQVG